MKISTIKSEINYEFITFIYFYRIKYDLVALVNFKKILYLFISKRILENSVFKIILGVNETLVKPLIRHLR